MVLKSILSFGAIGSGFFILLGKPEERWGCLTWPKTGIMCNLAEQNPAFGSRAQLLDLGSRPRMQAALE
jgi:hypothetical protein